MPQGNIAIIPARGGSKRIPGKNIRDFHGKPIIAYSIEAAKASGLFEKIIVSTDTDEIADVALANGANSVMWRNEYLAGDQATLAELMQSVAFGLIEARLDPLRMCCILATAPMIRPKDIAEGHKRLDAGWDYAFSATDAGPVYRSFTATPQGGVDMLFPQHINTRSQDLPAVLQDAAQFYWAKTDTWLHPTPIFGPRSCSVMIPRSRVVDIDTEEDWAIAERLFEEI